MKNIAYCVALVQQSLEDYTTHNFHRYLQFAIRAVRAMNFKFDKSVQVAYLTPNAAYLSPMPEDYEYYTKMAIRCGNGYVTLSVNKDIPLTREVDTCGQEVADALISGTLTTDSLLAGDWSGYGFYFASHYRAGQYVGEAYGMTGGFNEAGYFREDFERRQFQFYRVPRTTIMLEYMSSGDLNIGTVIPTRAVELIVAHTLWLISLNDSKSKDKVWRQGEYEYQKSLYKDQVWAFNVDEYLDFSYTTYRSSPRR